MMNTLYVSLPRITLKTDLGSAHTVNCACQTKVEHRCIMLWRTVVIAAHILKHIFLKLLARVWAALLGLIRHALRPRLCWKVRAQVFAQV